MQNGQAVLPPCVLLVEDEPVLSALVGTLLKEAGYAYESIADHDEITAAILRAQPQCVILDSDPGSNGHERSWADAAAIRRAHPLLPVLMFTADPESIAEARANTSERSRAAGYAGVLDKPFLVVEFLATLGRAVGVAAEGAPAPAELVTTFPELSGAAAEKWSVSDFFSTAVHELRTPLSGIDGQAQLAQRFLATDAARAGEALVRIRDQSARMNRLIGDLLDNARVAVGALSLRVSTFDLSALCAATCRMYQHEEPPRITMVTPGQPVLVRGDADRITQILGNLLTNAIKYSPSGSAIAVSLEVAGTEAIVRVTDHGVGVPAEEQGRLFMPFYRTSRTRSIVGTGLGLHISRRIAEQHHGRLWLDWSGDTGSAFVLALPLEPHSP